MVNERIILKASTRGNLRLINQARRDRIAIARHERSVKIHAWATTVFKGMIITMFLYILRQYQLGVLQIGLPS
jgi:hypothetical protein